MTIGDRIRCKREDKRISQIELANRIGVSKQTLYKYEKGVITNIPSNKIELLAQILETSESYLMGWSDDPSQQKKPAVNKDSELSQNKQKLIDFIQSVPDDKVEMIFRVIRSIVEDD